MTNSQTSADLLLELGCEDLPARYVRPLAEALGQIGAAMAARGIQVEGATRLFSTPRRIAVLVAGVADRQADQSIERTGPALAAAYKDGKPTPAALGFARACGVELDLIGEKDGKLHFSRKEKGRRTTELLPELFDEALKKMDALVPKRMRWGSGEETFVRPVQWITCLLGAKVIPLQRFGLQAGNKTFGHRFHAPKAIALKTPDGYETRLKAARVWADFESRKAEIRGQLEVEAKKLKGTARISEALLDEVTALVEWPVAIHGRMEDRFMQLPPEVIIATIELNQRYFPVYGPGGKLLPFFITVSNIQSRDVSQVVAGNERVVRPRLSDALFFYEQDLKKPLAEFVSGLDRVTFQKDLGSTGDKVRRVADLAARIAESLKDDPAVARRAATLCKADLVTRMVYEFPELQGAMGCYYALAAGEPESVARAIAEHYQPVQSGGAIPSTRVGQVVALADKLDTLAGIFAIGQKPTASKDPYALRRAALGALRICIEGPLPLDLRALLETALQAQPSGNKNAAQLSETWEFLLERLRGIVMDAGAAVEVFNAVAATGVTEPADFVARVEAVRGFLAMKQSTQLTAAHKRIRNILKQAGEGDLEVRPDHFREAQEHGLYEALTQLDEKVHAAAARRDYAGALKALSELQPPVDAFFDKVMVMAPEEELRANRVALLRRLDRLCRRVADISCLPG